MKRVAMIAAACAAACGAVPAQAADVYLQFSVGAAGTHTDYVPCVMAGANVGCPIDTPLYLVFSYAQTFSYAPQGVSSFHFGYLYSIGDISFDIRDLGSNVFAIENFTYGRVNISQDFYGIRPGSVIETASARPVTVAAANGVPESATWAMMIAGFGAIGARMRRRRTQVAFA